LLSFKAQSQLLFTPLEPFPGFARDDALAVQHEQNIYAGFGLAQGFFYVNDWWQYNLPMQKWTRLPNAPLAPQQYLRSFIIKDSLYVYGGTNGSQPQNATHAFWRYAFHQQEWKKLKKPPFEPRWAGIAFSAENFGYLGLGFNGEQNFKDFWQYNPYQDSWLPLPNFEGAARGKCIGVANLKEGMVAGGLEENDTALVFHEDIWHWSFENNSWYKSKTALPKAAAYFYASAIADGFLFGGGFTLNDTGGNVTLQEVYHYSGVSQRLEMLGELPKPFRRGGNLIKSSTNGFHLLWGLDSDLMRTNNFYQLDWQKKQPSQASFFPNPVIGPKAWLQSRPVRYWQIFSAQGKLVRRQHFNNRNDFRVFNAAGLEPGLYYLQLHYWNNQPFETLKISIL
jgi:hypothetical protein